MGGGCVLGFKMGMVPLTWRGCVKGWGPVTVALKSLWLSNFVSFFSYSKALLNCLDANCNFSRHVFYCWVGGG